MAGPEQARILTEFESQFLESEEHNSQQHEQGHSTQQLFKKQVNSLAEVISSMGNPFLDDCPELLILDTRNCASDAVVSTVQTIEELGATKYHQYMTERFTCVLYDKTTAITTVNDLRLDLFSKRAKLMDNIPPTQVSS